MIIAINCSCGTPYEVEMEGPTDEPILCPTCGADAMELANQQFATPEVLYCGQHSDQPAEAFCLVCHKPMCAHCLQRGGYICSELCRLRAKQQRLEVLEYDGQDSVVARKYAQARHLMAMAITTLVAVLLPVFLTGWIWFSFWGSKPGVVFSTPVSVDYDVKLCRFFAPQRAVFASNDQVAVFDTAKKKQLWSKSFSEVSQVEVGKRLLWVLINGELSAFDSESGEEQTRPPIKGPVVSISLAGEKLFVMTANRLAVVDGTSGGVVEELPAPEGTLHLGSERFQFPAETTFEAGGSVPVELLQAAAARHSSMDFESDSDRPTLDSFRREYSEDVQMEAKLKKENVVQREAMKPSEATALKDEGLTVSDTMAVMHHLANEQRRDRTGGIEHVDESTYQVQLRRLTEKGSVPWSGDVIGRPQFFPMQSVDLLVAGQTLFTFDKKGNKLWESKLSFPIADDATPAVESPSGLYFFDKGVLTAFDTLTGNVRWRLGSVGVSQIQFDAAGMLYVSTTNASPETIRYSQQIDYSNPSLPLVVKVDSASGKILWQVEKKGNRCYVSGKFVYFTSSRGAGGETYFRIYRINPRNGKELWEYYRPEEPLSIDFRDNQILALFPARLEVIKFFAF